MRIWLDTEFIDLGNTVLPLSFGLVRDDGEIYYAEPAETDRSLANAWVKMCVIKLMEGPVKPSTEIADDLRKFCGNGPEFWGYFPSYDWVLMCALFGGAFQLPARWPSMCLDVEQFRVFAGVPKLPEQKSTAHHALNDAMWTREAWMAIRRAIESQGVVAAKAARR